METTTQCQELIRSTNITRMIAERNEKLQAIAGIITTAEALGLADFIAQDSRRLNRLPEATQRLDCKYWAALMEDSGLMTYLSASRRQEFNNQIYHDKKPPAFTPEAIEATIGSLIENRAEEFEKAVVEVYRGLSFNYRTNSPVKFGKKLIIGYLFEAGLGHRGVWPKYSSTWNSISDLTRIMRLLDNQPVHEYKQELRNVVTADKGDGLTWGERTDFPDHYLAVKPYRNGNGHLIFLRPDLVTKLNQILAKHCPNALPAPA